MTTVDIKIKNSAFSKNLLLFLIIGAFIIKYLGGILSPFILSAFISALISPISKKIAEKTKISKKLISALLLICVIVSSILIICLLLSKLMNELNELSKNLSDRNTIHFFDGLGKILKAVLEKISSTFKIEIYDINDIDSLITETVNSSASLAINYLTRAIVSVATKIPKVLLFIISTVLSSYYFCSDGDRIKSYLSEFVSPQTKLQLKSLQKRLANNLIKYLKACFLLATVTFLITLAGLCLFRMKFAFLISMSTAIADLLPIIGAGTVLIPLSIYAFIALGTKSGLQILILYGILLIVRQSAESRIMGYSLGLHPLAALISVCAGVGLFGFSGIFVGPIMAIIAKEFLESTKIQSQNITDYQP